MHWFAVNTDSVAALIDCASVTTIWLHALIEYVGTNSVAALIECVPALIDSVPVLIESITLLIDSMSEGKWMP